jgi:NAD(P)-dependent dehydrogenase (short-subunit alcohol dehydrogenase family)
LVGQLEHIGHARILSGTIAGVANTWDISGKTVVITGASDGIGAVAAKNLAAQGANVVIVGRSADKLARVAAAMRADSGRDAISLTADFTSLDEVRKLASDLLDRLPEIHVLANNAGGVWPKRVVTPDGHEQTFQVNHLAPFLLTALLRERVAASAPARIITTASTAHRGGRLDLDDLDYERRRYSSMQAYGTSKLENILFTRELGRRLGGTDVTAVCLHPGTVATSFGRDSWFAPITTRYPVKAFFKSPEQGAETLVWLATAPTEALQPGGYYVSRKLGRPTQQAQDDTAAADLWSKSAALLGVPA